MSEGKTEQPLDMLRKRIDTIDAEIQALINERASCAQQVAEVKMQSGGVEQPLFTVPSAKLRCCVK